MGNIALSPSDVAVTKLFKPFLDRAKRVGLDESGVDILLDAHEAVARHAAEQDWLRIVSTTKVTPSAYDEIATRLATGMQELLRMTSDFHREVGLLDLDFNRRVYELVGSAYMARLSELSDVVDWGRA